MSLKPGPALDRLVAEALGYKLKDEEHIWLREICGFKRIPPFSTDPGEAIKALEEFCLSHNYFYTIKENLYTQKRSKSVRIVRNDGWLWGSLKSDLPLAICLAIVEAAAKEA